jgi:sterol desaturase/sphingolipid hydroxylase (fatty acid hydroxylase superfamily)
MDWVQLSITTGVLYVIILVRYFAIAGLFYWLLWGRAPEKVHARKLTDIVPAPRVMRHEIKWSAISSIIYAIPGAIMLEAWKHGGTAMYTDVGVLGWAYVPVSILLYLFVHDTYFYWTHRLMHRPKLFRIFHKVHHESRQPTPWAAFSFHPYESIVGAVIVPALVFVVPIHVGAILFILVLMTVCSVINHTGFEIFPDRWLRGFLGRHVISAAHHNLHHQNYRVNFALYFRFWDKLMGTDIMEERYEFLAPDRARAPSGA